MMPVKASINSEPVEAYLEMSQDELNRAVVRNIVGMFAVKVGIVVGLHLLRRRLEKAP